MVRTCSAGARGPGRVIMPAWQKRQPRVHPRNTSTLSRSCTTSVSGYERCPRVRPFAQVGDRALVDRGGTSANRGRTSAIRCAVVRDVVHRRHVHAGIFDSSRRNPSRLVRPASFQSRTTFGDVGDDLLALTEHGGVDEVGERLGIERGVAADHDERSRSGPRSAVCSGMPARSIISSTFVNTSSARQVERQDVEVGGRAVGVDREQRYARAAHLGRQVEPGRIRALGDRVVALVQDFVEDLEPLVGEADLVGVGVCEQPRHRAPVGQLVVPGGGGTVFAADVTSRLLHPGQERFDPRPE